MILIFFCSRSSRHTRVPPSRTHPSSAFPTPSIMTGYIYSIGFLYIILILGNVVGNAGFIVLFLLSRKVRKSVSIFMISLAIADLAFPLIVVPIHLNNLISGTWQRGALSCRLRTFAYLVAASSSILSFCCVTVERYIRIFFPMRYNMNENVKRVSVAIAVLWLYSFGSSAFVFADFLDWSHTPLSGVCSHTLPMNLFLALFVLTYCVPLTVMFVLYDHILKISRRHRKQIAHVSGNPATTTKNSTKRARKQHPTVFMLLFHFVACWLPISVFSLVLKTHYDSQLAWPKWTGHLYQFLNVLAFSNSVLNPFIYGYTNSHFKAALRNYISRRSAKVSPIPTQSTAFVVRSRTRTILDTLVTRLDIPKSDTPKSF